MLVHESLDQQGVLAAIDQIGVTVPGRTGGLEAAVKQDDSVFTLLDSLRVASIRKEIASALRGASMPPTLTPETGYPSHSLLYCTADRTGPYSEECPLLDSRPMVLGALFMHVADGVDRPALIVGEHGRKTGGHACPPSLTLLVDDAPLAAMESERFDELGTVSAVERGLFGEATEGRRRAAAVTCAEYMSDRLVREPFAVIHALRIDSSTNETVAGGQRPLYHRHVGVAPFLRLRPASTAEEEAALAEHVLRALASGRVSDALLIPCATPDGDASEHSAARGFAGAVAGERYGAGDPRGGLVVSTVFSAPVRRSLDLDAPAPWLSPDLEGGIALPSDDTLEVRGRLAAACARRAAGIAVAAEVAAMLLFWGPTSTVAAMDPGRGAWRPLDDTAGLSAARGPDGGEDDDEYGAEGLLATGECTYPVEEMNEVIGAMTLRDTATRGDAAAPAAPAAEEVASVGPKRVSLSLSSASSSDGEAPASRPAAGGGLEGIRAFAPAVARAREAASNATWAAQAIVDMTTPDSALPVYRSMFNGLAHALGLAKEPVPSPPIPARGRGPGRRDEHPFIRVHEAGMLLAEQLAANPDSTCAPEGRVLVAFTGRGAPASSGCAASRWAPPWRPCAAPVISYVYMLCRRPGEAAILEEAVDADRALRIYRRLDVCTFCVELGVGGSLQCHHVSWRVATRPGLWLKQSTVARKLRDGTVAPCAPAPQPSPESVLAPGSRRGSAPHEPSPDWVAAIVRQTLAQVAAPPEEVDAEGAAWLKRTTDSLDAAHHVLVNVMGPKRRRA